MGNIQVVPPHHHEGNQSSSSSSSSVGIKMKKKNKLQVLRNISRHLLRNKKSKPTQQNHPTMKANTNSSSQIQHHHHDDEPYATSMVSVLSLSSLPTTLGAMQQLFLMNQQEPSSSPKDHHHYLPNTPRIVRTCFDDLKLNQTSTPEQQVQALKRAAYKSQSCSALMPLSQAWDETTPITPTKFGFYEDDDDEFIEPTSPMTMTRFFTNIMSTTHSISNNNNNNNNNNNKTTKQSVVVVAAKPLHSTTQYHSNNNSTTNLSQDNTSNTNLSQFNASTNNLRMNENGEWEDDETYSCSSSSSTASHRNAESMSDCNDDEEDYIDQFIKGETTEVELSSSIAYLKNSFVRCNTVVI